MTRPALDTPQMLTPAEVARLFAVDPRTVTRWAREGKLRFIRTVGSHRRYYRADIERLLNGEQVSP